MSSTKTDFATYLDSTDLSAETKRAYTRETMRLHDAVLGSDDPVAAKAAHLATLSKSRRHQAKAGWTHLITFISISE